MKICFKKVLFLILSSLTSHALSVNFELIESKEMEVISGIDMTDQKRDIQNHLLSLLESVKEIRRIVISREYFDTITFDAVKNIYSRMNKKIKQLEKITGNCESLLLCAKKPKINKTRKISWYGGSLFTEAFPGYDPVDTFFLTAILTAGIYPLGVCLVSGTLVITQGAAIPLTACTENPISGISYRYKFNKNNWILALNDLERSIKTDAEKFSVDLNRAP